MWRAVATTALLSTAFAAPAFGQEDEEPPRRMRFGLYAGRSWANVSDPSLSAVLVEAAGVKQEKRGGGQIGGYLSFPMGRRWSIQPEVHYVQKGVTFSLSGDGNFPGTDPEPLPYRTTFELRLAYFEMPVLARVDLGRKTTGSRVFLVGGPFLSVRGRCQYAVTAATFDFTIDCDATEALGLDESEDPIRSFDYGLIGGAGVAFRIFGFEGSMQGRYGKSLATLSSNDDVSKAKNSLVSFLFAFEF
jgi:hypothetical protein